MEDGPEAPRARGPNLRLLLAAAVALTGVVWILQGLGILTGGSFMVGDPLWVAIGAVVMAAGVSLGWRIWREGR